MWAMWAKKDIVLICFFGPEDEKISMLKQVEINAISVAGRWHVTHVTKMHAF